jgi:hypothetical protein
MADIVNATIEEIINADTIIPFLNSQEDRSEDPMMFRQCTKASTQFKEKINESLKSKGSSFTRVIIHGRWIAELSDRFRIAARAMNGVMTTKNKRDHQWLAIGPADDLKVSFLQPISMYTL